MTEKIKTNTIFLKSSSGKINKIEKPQKRKIILTNKILNNKELRQKDTEDDVNYDYSDDLLLNENLELSPINPIPCFTVKSETSQKEISSQITFLSNNSKNINISKDSNNKNNNKKDKTKILNKNFKKSHINNISNNKYFRFYSPNISQNPKIFKSENAELIHPHNIITENNFSNKQNKYEIFLSNKKKFISNINKKNIINSKNLIPNNTNNINIRRHKFLNHLYFSTDNFYESKFSEENLEKIETKKEKKERKMKLISQKINVVNMKIEILQNYKKNKNLNSIKKQIEYKRIFCNNDIKRLKDKYYTIITQLMNQIKYIKIKLIKSQEDYVHINKHKDIINKEEILFKIKKIELIEKILYLKKKLNDLINTEITTYDTFNLDNYDDSFEEQTIKNVSFNDYSILKDTNIANYNYSINGKYIKSNNKLNEVEAFGTNKIIKVNQYEKNFFKTKFVNK